MLPKTRIFLSAAKDDYITLSWVDIPERSFGQHAQASIEKYLKALILEHGEEPIYTHDLDLLVKILEKMGETMPPLSLPVGKFTDYGIGLRYEDISEFATLDRPETIKTIETIRDFVELRIKQLNK